MRTISAFTALLLAGCLSTDPGNRAVVARPDAAARGGADLARGTDARGTDAAASLQATGRPPESALDEPHDEPERAARPPIRLAFTTTPVLRFQDALSSSVHRVRDGDDVYLNVQTDRPLNRLVGPGSPIRIELMDSARPFTLETCTVLPDSNEARRTEISIALSPLRRRGRSAPPDCFLLAVTRGNVSEHKLNFRVTLQGRIVAQTAIVARTPSGAPSWSRRLREQPQQVTDWPEPPNDGDAAPPLPIVTPVDEPVLPLDYSLQHSR